MNTTTSEMTDALKQTLVIRVPITVRHQTELSYEQFVEEFVSSENDEDTPTVEARARKTWEALITLYNRGNGYVDLEEIDGGECDENDVLNDYDEAKDAFQDVVDSALEDLKRFREREAQKAAEKAERAEWARKAKEQAEQKAKEAAEKAKEAEQKAKEAEEFAAWKKAKEEAEKKVEQIVTSYADLQRAMADIQARLEALKTA